MLINKHFDCLRFRKMYKHLQSHLASYVPFYYGIVVSNYLVKQR